MYIFIAIKPSRHVKMINSLASGKFEWNFRYLIFQIISVLDGWVISCELALRWMSLDLIDDNSTLVQVMAWCRQATSHYLSQCWPRSLSPYGVTRPQWVNFYLHPVLIYAQNCVIFIADTLETLQSCTTPWILFTFFILISISPVFPPCISPWCWRSRDGSTVHTVYTQ